MYTLATLCDGNQECSDGHDENVNQDTASKESWYLLLYTTLGFIVLYLTLKTIRCFSHNLFCKDLSIMDVKKARSEFANFELQFLRSNPKTYRDHIIEEYETNHDKNIETVNLYLHQIMETETEDVKKQIGLQFFEMESRVHNNKENEVYSCLHRNLDPKLSEMVNDAKYPGFKQKTIEEIERWIGKKIVTNTLNTVRKNEVLSQIVYTLQKIISLILTYTDMFKDVFITLYILGKNYWMHKNVTLSTRQSSHLSSFKKKFKQT